MAGVVVVTKERKSLGYMDVAPVLEIIKIDWTADADDGSVPSASLGEVLGILQRLVTDPGTPAPTNLYDIVMVDEDGFDVLGGVGADRSATVTQEAEIKMTTCQRVVANFVTFTLTNNIVDGAKGIARLYSLR